MQLLAVITVGFHRHMLHQCFNFQGFSLSLWINIHSFPEVRPSQHFFFKYGEEGNGFFLKTYRHGHGLKSMMFMAKDSRPGALKTSYRIDPSVAENTWNHYVFTYKFNDPSNLASHFKAYFNGVTETLQHANTWGAIESKMGVNILLSGKQKAGTGSQVSVDDISLFDGVLSAAHVLELFQLYS